MTRINAGIPPKTLTDKHLIAEHREIKRLPNQYAKLLALPDSKLQQFKLSVYLEHSHFTLGSGHVKFFLFRGIYTYKRYQAIYRECQKRGFNVTDYSEAWEVYHSSDTIEKVKDNPDLQGLIDYVPDMYCVYSLLSRITERLQGKSIAITRAPGIIDYFNSPEQYLKSEFTHIPALQWP